MKIKWIKSEMQKKWVLKLKLNNIKIFFIYQKILYQYSVNKAVI